PVEKPENLSQTFIFWAVSTLVFVLTITLGFILFRTGVKLYIERRRNREGSSIEPKLYFGALALSFMPVCFLVFFSYAVLNRQIEKWFFYPSEQLKLNYQTIDRAFQREVGEQLNLKTAVLAGSPEVGSAGSLDAFAGEQSLAAGEIPAVPGGEVLDKCGDPALPRWPAAGIRIAQRRIREGTPEAALITLGARLPVDIAATQSQIA